MFCLFDDQMISMTYAKNLLNGYGLNWAKYGDNVEGFSNPLWTFYMVFIHVFIKNLYFTSLAVQLTSMAILLANLYFVYRIASDYFTTPKSRYVFPAIALTAFYYPLNHWSLQGFEVSLQALLITSVTWLLFNSIFHKQNHNVAIFSLLLTGTLLRMDMFIFAGIVMSAMSYYALRFKDIRRHFIKGIMIFLGGNLLYLLFRYYYFSEWLPNTYYLKIYGIDEMLRIRRGLYVFMEFFKPITPIFLISTSGILFLRDRRGRYLLLLSIIFMFFAYSVYIGGDAWEWSSVGANRWISIVMPLFFIVLNGLLNELNSIVQKIKVNDQSRRVIGLIILVTVSVYSFLAFNGLLHSPDKFEKLKDIVVINRPLHVDDHKRMVKRTFEMRKIASRHVTVATLWGGIPSYFLENKMVDLLGYNDKFLSRLPVDISPDDYKRYKPGHVKNDLSYSIGILKPDVLFDLNIEGTLMQRIWVMEEFPYVERFDFMIRRIANKGKVAVSFLSADNRIYGKRYYHFRFETVIPGIITSIQIRGNNDKSGGADTIPNNAYKELLVMEGEKMLNFEDGIYFNVTKPLIFDLYVDEDDFSFVSDKSYTALIHYKGSGYFVVPIEVNKKNYTLHPALMIDPKGGTRP